MGIRVGRFGMIGGVIDVWWVGVVEGWRKIGAFVSVVAMVDGGIAAIGETDIRRLRA